MDSYTFKVGDRVRHLKLGRVGRVTHITPTELRGAPEKKRAVYRVKFDDFPSTLEVREGELVRE